MDLLIPTWLEGSVLVNAGDCVSYSKTRCFVCPHLNNRMR